MGQSPSYEEWMVSSIYRGQEHWMIGCTIRMPYYRRLKHRVHASDLVDFWRGVRHEESPWPQLTFCVCLTYFKDHAQRMNSVKWVVRGLHPNTSTLSLGLVCVFQLKPMSIFCGLIISRVTKGHQGPGRAEHTFFQRALCLELSTRWLQTI